MALSAFTVFFLLTTISSPLIHARDGQFFSKVTAKPTETVVLPNKAQEQQSLVNKQDIEATQQPEFVPQNESGYGLYGHETGLSPPESDVVAEAPSTYANDKTDGFATEQFGNGNGETFYSNNRETEKYDTSSNTEKDDLLNFDDAFDPSKYGKGETFYANNNNGVGTEHYTTESESLQNTQKDKNGEESYYNYNTDRSGRLGSQLGQTETTPYYSDNDNDNDNDSRFDTRFTDKLNSRYKAYRGESSAGERKGMSDTMFLENGKYHYDLEKEEQNQYDSSRNTYSKYDDASYDKSGADKYEVNTMEYEKSRLNNQYDP